MIVACAWCVPTQEVEDAMRQGAPISHTVCEDHYQQFLEELHGRSQVHCDIAASGLPVGPGTRW